MCVALVTFASSIVSASSIISASSVVSAAFDTVHADVDVLIVYMKKRI